MRSKPVVPRERLRGRFIPTGNLARTQNRVPLAFRVTPAMRIALEAMAAERGITLTQQIVAMLARQIDQEMVRERDTQKFATY